MYVIPRWNPIHSEGIRLPQHIDGQFDPAQWASQQIDEERMPANSAIPSGQTNEQIALPDLDLEATFEPSSIGDRENKEPPNPQSNRTQSTESERRPAEPAGTEDLPGRSVLPDGSTPEDTTSIDQPELCPPEPADPKVQRQSSFQPASPTVPRTEFVRHASSTPSDSTGTWWEDPLHEQMRPDCESLPTTLESLIVRALEHSAQVQVISDLPLIRKTTIMEADAAFDWRAFMETRWDDISAPVGNVLTVGPGRNRFQDHLWKFDAGVRRKNRLGGQFEMSQRLGFENSNSVFFVPQDQGTTRLSMSYTQPLLRGAGEVYNSSLIMLAEIDTEVAYDEFVSELQTHLLEITRAYWTLYLERGALLQKGRLYDRAKAVLSELEARAEVDAAASQIARAHAAVTQREADLLRSEMAVRNAEDRIAALVNDPEFKRVPEIELIPLDVPTCGPLPLDMQQAVSTAYRERPEIDQALQEIKAASVRLDMSEKEILPQLDLVLETYVSGLRGETEIGGSLGDQFSEGQPAYSVGLLYEVPIHNRAAHAKHVRRQLELRQLQNQFRATVETLMLEVKMAVREVDTAYREMLAKKRSMQAAGQRLDYIEERWQHLPGEERSGGLYLEDLLVAQEQLAAAEYGYLMASTTYSLALMNLKRATGTLLQDERISRAVIEVDGLPSGILNKDPLPEPSSEPTSEPDLDSLPILGAPAERKPESVLRQEALVPLDIEEPLLRD